jgi:integrase
MSVLDLIKRHRAECKLKGEENARHAFKCGCAFYIDTNVPGPGRLISLKTSVRTRANEMLRDMELGIKPMQLGSGAPSVEQACRNYLADCASRRLEQTTLNTFAAILTGRPSATIFHKPRKAPPLAGWAAANGIRAMSDWRVESMDAYRRTWTDKPATARNRLTVIRTFFTWCQDRDLCRINVAQKVRMPKVKECPTLPFEAEEFQALVDGCMEPFAGETAEDALNRQRLRALLLVLRYSGLRISDAIQLDDHRFEGNRLFLYQHKTGQPVYVPMPEWVRPLLEKTPRCSQQKYFLHPQFSRKQNYDRWLSRLEKIGRRAKVPHPTFHRIRDTFAVATLEAGGTLEALSVLLGHRSIKVTEAHYRPWVRSRQDQMEKAMRVVLEADPFSQRMALLESPLGAKN